jgi:3-oxosteroid 1-dehydrogenase
MPPPPETQQTKKKTERVFDFVIIGSGGAAACAALVLHEARKSALIIDKSQFFGGSTALSDGTIWIPSNSLQKEAGVADSPAQASAYLDACAGPHSKGSSAARRNAFLKNGPLAMDFLRFNGMKLIHAEGCADYDLAKHRGGNPRGRTVVPAILNLEELRRHEGKIAFDRKVVPIMAHEVNRVVRSGGAIAGGIIAAKLRWRQLQMRLLRRKLVAGGPALQGRLLKIAVQTKLRIWLDAPVTSLTHSEGRVTGVMVQRGSNEMRVIARDGVLINSGSFAHNPELRAKWLHEPYRAQCSAGYPGDTGEILQMAVALGADLDGMDMACELFASQPPKLETRGGLVIDEFARVLDHGGLPIAGLYAAGRATASLFRAGNPGPGAVTGESLTFGFIAAHHASRLNPV